MMDLKDFDRLTSLIYSAAYDQTRWQCFLDDLVQVAHIGHAQLFGFDTIAKTNLGLVSTGYDPDYEQSFSEYYHELNSWAHQFHWQKIGKIYQADETISFESLSQTEFYNDWVAPQDVGCSAGAVLFRDQTRAIGYGVNFSRQKVESHADSAQQALQLVTPHLQQSFEIARIIANQCLELDLLHSEQVSSGDMILLVAENGYLHFANRSAQRAVDLGELIRSNHEGRLAFVNQAANAHLHQCLLALRAGQKTISATFTPDGKRLNPLSPLLTDPIIRIVRLDPETLGETAFPALLRGSSPSLQITISFPKHDDCDAFNLYASKCGLTKTESEVAIGISDGHSLNAIARMRGVSIHTIRSQAKSLMGKMDVNRQAEIVRIVENLRSR